MFIEQANLNTVDCNVTIFTCPVSDSQNGIKFTTESGHNNDFTNKPDRNDFWMNISYIISTKTCTHDGNDVFSGDFFLVYVLGQATINYSGVTFTCN